MALNFSQMYLVKTPAWAVKDRPRLFAKAAVTNDIKFMVMLEPIPTNRTDKKIVKFSWHSKMRSQEIKHLNKL